MIGTLHTLADGRHATVYIWLPDRAIYLSVLASFSLKLMCLFPGASGRLLNGHYAWGHHCHICRTGEGTPIP